MRKINLMPLVAVLASSALLVSGCKSGDAGGATGGVGDKTIKLGALIDLSGPFAATGKDFAAGMQMGVNELNKDGGICDRDVELVIKDHGYDVQKGVLAYDEVEPSVAMFSSVFGSAITAALKDKIEADDVLAIPTSYSSFLLGVDNFVLVGATYDLQAINGLSWMVDQGMLAKGDTVGEFYLEGELGEDSHQGVVWAAKQLGLKVKPYVLKPTDSDVASPVSALRKADAKAIVMATTGAQVASVAGAGQSSGLDVPIMGVGPTWNTAMLDTSAGSALEKNFYRAFVSYGLGDRKLPLSMELTKQYEKSHGGKPALSGSGVVAGYGAVHTSQAVLEKTCDDLSRKAILKARSEVEPFDVDGAYPSLDISDPSKSSTTEVLIEKADKSSVDGVKVIEPFFASDLVQKYLASK